MEQKFIQIKFQEDTPYGAFCDALYFTESEYATKTQSDIDALKTERCNNYIATIENAKNAPVVEPTKEELEANKVSLLTQIAEIEAQIAEVDKVEPTSEVIKEP